MATIPTHDEIKLLHQRYAPGEAAFNLVYTHCQIVAEVALWCANNISQAVDQEVLEAACLLHDIGTYIFFDADGEHTKNQTGYKQHAIFGAALVAEEDYDPRIAEAIRTHVLLGLTKQEIIDNNMRLPLKNFEPTTIEGRLLCYADRFNSKGPPRFTTYQKLLTGFKDGLPKQASKFEASAAEFGIPDVAALAVKYRLPII